jgi:hypothetical protein
MLKPCSEINDIAIAPSCHARLADRESGKYAPAIVRIRHANGSNTGYAHLESFAPGITVGVNVSRGQQIGTLGTSGAEACHLHAHYQDAGGTHRECPTCWVRIRRRA